MSISTFILRFALAKSKLDIQAKRLRNKMDWTRLQVNILKKLHSSPNLKTIVVEPTSRTASAPSKPELMVDTLVGLGLESCLSRVNERGVLLIH